ncbi:MAG: flagellar export chaperone FliS [Proteobacteria bacterium SG_bin7]|nr:MAG: flagellar export chaperone FliS [Proteobacteria bacterium SG_bin7]
MNNPYQKYKATAVQSASREKLLLMLYEAAIKFCKLAIVACEKKNISDRGLNIGKAYDIVMELANTLDHTVGGDISKNLEQLYIFMMDQLTKANITGNAEHLQNVLKLLETLYEAWVGAIEKLKKDTEPREG